VHDRTKTMKKLRPIAFLASLILPLSLSPALLAQQVTSAIAQQAPSAAAQQVASETPAFSTSLFAMSDSLPDTPESLPKTAESLPDTPVPQTASDQNAQHIDGQSKRIFGIIPNFRSVNADVHLPPQTVKQKFVTATQDSFDYSSIFIPILVAGYDDARGATPEFGSGGIGYARYLWHSVVDQTSENYLVEFIVPVITHEDTRYYSLQRGGFLKRATYSLSRAVITRSDSGARTFNFSEVIGAGAAAGVSNLYYPSRERSFGNTGSQWGTSIGIDAISFFVKEFSPDITHAVLHSGKSFHFPGSSSNQ
jgi:hypothetical protein